MATPYFATLQGSDLAREVMKRVERFYTHLFRDPYYRRALESYRTFHGLPTPENPWDNIDVLSTVDGSGGALSRVKSGTYSAIGQSLITLTTSNRPSIQPMAQTTDVASTQATLLATDLLEYFFKKKGLEKLEREAVASAVVMQDGYVLQVWNETAGNALEVDGVPVTDPDSGMPLFTGDLEARALTPFDVALDLDWRGDGERPWVVTRAFVNKADLAAQWPAFADEIERQTVTNKPEHRWPDSFGPWGRGSESSDQVATWTLWHRKTRAVPGGLMAIVLDGGTLLFQGPLPFGDHLPLYRVSAGVQMGTTKGRSPLILQLALQKGLDVGLSVALTNLSVWGPGSMTSPKGTGINVSDLGGGAKVFEYDPPEMAPNSRPEPMAMPMTAGAVFQTTELMTRSMEANSGANSSVRGQAPVEFSGAAQALQVEQARQFTSELQGSFVEMHERLANGLLTILKTYAKAPQVAVIVGKNKLHMLKRWQAEDLQGVDNVVCTVGSGVTNTIAGRLQVASDFMAKGLITPQQYLELSRTGELEAETDPTELVTLGIREENELLAQGQNPPVLFADDDGEHLKWHLSGLASQEVRNNPVVAQAFYAHIQKHLWKQQQPPGKVPMVVPDGAAPMPPPPPPAPPALPPGTTGIMVAPPHAPGANPGQVMNGAGPQRMPQQPSLPKSPLTGQKFQP